MPEYYQNLLNECIYLHDDYVRLDEMKKTLKTMKKNLRQLKINKVRAWIQRAKLNIKKAEWINFMKGV